MFQGLLKFASGSPPRSKPNAKSGIPCKWYGLWMKKMALIVHFRGIHRTYLKLIKKKWKITICNRLDSETIGF